MPMDTYKSPEALARENEELRARLKEAEETLQAIRLGEIDAVVVTGTKNDQIFMLEGADHAYRVMVEQMSESAGTLRTDGLVLFCNTIFSFFWSLLRSASEDAFSRTSSRPATRRCLPAFLNKPSRIGPRARLCSLRPVEGKSRFFFP
ncbi:hypothetical protein GTA51_19740 [Desulfovibrio aerotolerans]|uniref:Uncharacterized protein n=1 Tax=Solidesulfovibrio aerotolerans TaxID=295255 RepID=A0A7C9MHU2_9BACT|nr:hypothetical protein [Solidesulfovibrio aerotolerans]MYL85330.1 hypothetical protein [Solidesulfovibrio aerotolerans]